MDLRALARWSYKIGPVGPFSTLVEVRLGIVVGPSIFLDNRSKDLHETWHDCRDRYSKKTDESFFVKKFVNP